MGAIIQVFGGAREIPSPCFFLPCNAVLLNALAIIPSVKSNVKVKAVQHEVAVFPFNGICKPHSTVQNYAPS